MSSVSLVASLLSKYHCFCFTGEATLVQKVNDPAKAAYLGARLGNKGVLAPEAGVSVTHRRVTSRSEVNGSNNHSHSSFSHDSGSTGFP